MRRYGKRKPPAGCGDQRDQLQRRQSSNNNFSAVVPYDLEQQRKETREMLDDLTTRDQRMLFAVVTLVQSPDSKEELDSDTETLESTARKHLCQLSTPQLAASGRATYRAAFGRWIDALLTHAELLAVLMPFKEQEIRHQGGVMMVRTPSARISSWLIGRNCSTATDLSWVSPALVSPLPPNGRGLALSPMHHLDRPGVNSTAPSWKGWAARSSTFPPPPATTSTQWTWNRGMAMGMIPLS